MKTLLSRLQKHTFVRSVAVLAGGTALSQGLVVLASPLLTRLYTPEDFGVLAVFVSLFSLLLTINSLRYELAIPLPEDEEGAINLFVLVIALVMLTTVLFGAVFWIFGSRITHLMNAPALEPYLGLLAPSLLAGGVYQAFNFLAVRREAFQAISQSKIGQSIGMVGTQVVLGLTQASTVGLTLGVMIGQVFGIPVLMRYFGLRETVSQFSLKGMKSVAARYRRFPLYTSWASFLNMAGLQLPVVLVTSVFNPEIAGWFALGHRVISLPMALIGVSVGQVYLSRASQLVKEDPGALRYFYDRTARSLLLLGVLPIAVLALIGPWLFALVFGEEWRTAGEYIQILAPLMLVQFVVSSVSQNIYVIERQDIQSAWDVVRVLVVIGTFVLADLLSLTPHAAIALYAVGGIAAYLILFVMNRRALRTFTLSRL